MALAGLCVFLLLAGMSDLLSARIEPYLVSVTVHYFPTGPYRWLGWSGVDYVKGELHHFSDACDNNVTCAPYFNSVNSSDGSNICANLAKYADCLDTICNNSTELGGLTKSFGEMCISGSAFLYFSTLTLLLSILTFKMLK